MFAFVLTITILLPPINAIQVAHPLHQFTVQSTPAYASVQECARAVNDTKMYIAKHLPPGSQLDMDDDCYISDLVEAYYRSNRP